MLAGLVYLRCWNEIKLLLFMVPTSFTALLIYCGRGTWLYSSYHLVLLALLLAWAYRLSLPTERVRSI